MFIVSIIAMLMLPTMQILLVKSQTLDAQGRQGGTDIWELGPYGYIRISRISKK
jgi:hypothetical protein